MVLQAGDTIRFDVIIKDYDNVLVDADTIAMTVSDANDNVISDSFSFDHTATGYYSVFWQIPTDLSTRLLRADVTYYVDGVPHKNSISFEVGA